MSCLHARLVHKTPELTHDPEGIAELFNKPLFQITCGKFSPQVFTLNELLADSGSLLTGDLGTQAKDVEIALEKNFSLANKWGSILLLDEADVFLARRTPQDFVRNGLVAGLSTQLCTYIPGATSQLIILI